MGAQARRIGDLVNDIEEGRLVVRPYFQRRQVWTNKDKEFFIDTILKSLPFPEIFCATGQLDHQTMKRVNWLVDGQQRVAALCDYVRGSTDLLYRTIPRFEQLPKEKKTAFLDYEVVVRDLGTVGDKAIKEIFERINSTDYALKSMERLNALFSGEYKRYCEALSRQPFFVEHKVFSVSAQKRMHDVSFCVILVTTILTGYYRRDEKHREYLERYNDDFPQEKDIQAALDRVFDFVESCEFAHGSRAWRQTDLLTLLVELHSALIVQKLSLDPTRVGPVLRSFYERVDSMYANKKVPAEQDVPVGEEWVFTYLKAATKATNDKYARAVRAEVVAKVIQSTADKAG